MLTMSRFAQKPCILVSEYTHAHVVWHPLWYLRYLKDWV